MRKKKVSTAFRVSAEAKALIKAIAEHLGITQTSVFEIAIREKAKREGVTLPQTKDTDEDK